MVHWLFELGCPDNGTWRSYNQTGEVKLSPRRENKEHPRFFFVIDMTPVMDTLHYWCEGDSPE